MATLYIVGASAPRRLTAQSDEAPAGGAAQGFKVQDNGQADSARVIHDAPLLADACHCRAAGYCMTCRRFARYERKARARRALWVQRGRV